MTRPRLLHRPRYARQRTLVQHIVHPFASLADAIGIPQIHRAQIDPVEYALQIAPQTGLKVIHPPTLPSASHQSMRKMRPDEPSGTGDEISRQAPRISASPAPG